MMAAGSNLGGTAGYAYTRSRPEQNESVRGGFSFGKKFVTIIMSWKYEETCSAEKEYVCGKEDGFYIKYVEFSLESAVCCQHAMKKKRPLPVWLL